MLRTLRLLKDPVASLRGTPARCKPCKPVGELHFDELDKMISCDDIRERAVIDAAGLAIGEVDSLLIDPASWHVDAIHVRLRREMTEQVGAARSFFRKSTIDISTTLVQSVGDAVLLHVKADELRDSSHAEEQVTHATR